MPEVGDNVKKSAGELEAAVLADLQAKAGGREAEWCQNFPKLLSSPDWDVKTTYASELAALRSSPIGFAPQAGVHPTRG